MFIPNIVIGNVQFIHVPCTVHEDNAQWVSHVVGSVLSAEYFRDFSEMS
jgi:hypothetical protein